MVDSTQQDKQSQQILSPNPFPPYEGADPYVFVSYSRKDKNRVVPIITELHNRGYRVWYDAGIHAGEKWPAEIAAHVERCDVFMPLYTAAFNDSEWCNNEINHALSLKKTIIGVYLEDVQLKPEIQIRIRSFQHLAFRDGEDEEIFLNRMSREPNLISCLEQEKFLQWQTARQEAERKAREEAARQEAERKAREEAMRREAERKVREEAARQEAERKAREEAARQEAERKAREEAARQEAERKAREEAARQEAERKAREEAMRREAERRAREEAARREAERKMREENSKREVMSAGRYFLFIKQKDSPPRMVKFWSENGTPYDDCIQKTLALIFLIILSAYLIFTNFSEFMTWFTSFQVFERT